MRKFVALAVISVAVSTLGGCWWGPPWDHGGEGHHGGGDGGWHGR